MKSRRLMSALEARDTAS